MKQCSASHPLHLDATEHSLRKAPTSISRAIGQPPPPWLRGTLCKTAPACQPASPSHVGPSMAGPRTRGSESPWAPLGYARHFVQRCCHRCHFRHTPRFIFKYTLLDPYSTLIRPFCLVCPLNQNVPSTRSFHSLHRFFDSRHSLHLDHLVGLFFTWLSRLSLEH